MAKWRAHRGTQIASPARRRRHRQVKHGFARFATALSVLSNRHARPFHCKLDSGVRPSAIIGANPPSKRDASFVEELSNCSTP